MAYPAKVAGHDGVGSKEIGDRVSYTGARGTVRYRGGVAGHDGVYLGIEWDEDSGRGTHDGVVNGTRLFDTISGGKASCVREIRIGSGGQRSFEDVVYEKYEVHGDLPLEERVRWEQRNQVELVGHGAVVEGRDKVLQLERISLQGTGVCSFDVGVMQKMTQLQEVDLSRTLISSWSALWGALYHLPRLTTLNVSENVFKTPLACENLPKLSNLKTLVARACHFDWSDIRSILSLTPSVEEAYVPRNKIRDFGGAPPDSHSDGWELSSLQLLDVSANGVTSWKALVKSINCFPSLRSLSLRENPIEELTVVSGKLWNSLRDLNISGTRLSSWKSVDVINQLGTLESVRLSECPLPERSRDNDGGESFEDGLALPSVRQEAISRLSSIIIINGSAVSREERKESEKLYLRFCAWQHKHVNSYDLEMSISSHPRLMELSQAYDFPLPQDDEGSDASRRIVRTGLGPMRMIRFSMHAGMHDEDQASKVVEKLIPCATPILKLPRIACRLLGVNLEDVRVKLPPVDERRKQSLSELVEVESLLSDYVVITPQTRGGT
mmetsp:Transcript_898/g.1945  ORF Transcript_898/g.1945 Transcript_898/m.1945 type:complete len:553 (-) Transcript_898:700-2358(-)|eukprot:CAMPEP_0184689852 /NCGR_PEP_ID=MMETSP0312-20130426/30888_1 /TAXON_ID=31354 /ORGANISM="Compsopogon coeruleus, Strain SAG 36.94" /LENGTH=552 /DNA_ID=CAMNT_0027147253 /DNA_START=1663 /DNA_END=3321 /DNA_ORIENTATION=-